MVAVCYLGHPKNSLIDLIDTSNRHLYCVLLCKNECYKYVLVLIDLVCYYFTCRKHAWKNAAFMGISGVW